MQNYITDGSFVVKLCIIVDVAERPAACQAGLQSLRKH